jgi:hypothetical protein
MLRLTSRVRRALLASLLLAALVPAAADARIIEIGQTSGAQPTPSCPGKPCLAVSRTTGFQSTVAGDKGVVRAPKLGKVVAWSITLGDPNKKQIDFFDSGFGGAPSAGISVFRPTGKANVLRLISHSPVKRLTPYLGQTVQFPLDRALHVHPKDVVALTVPSWAPALAVGSDKHTSWKATRSKGKCDDTSTQTAFTALKLTTRFDCRYTTSRPRLTYTATMITSPVKPSSKKKH